MFNLMVIFGLASFNLWCYIYKQYAVFLQNLFDEGLML